jgi:hypothetical protein
MIHEKTHIEYAIVDILKVRLIQITSVCSLAKDFLNLKTMSKTKRYTNTDELI